MDKAKQLFLCPGLVFRKPDGDYVVITYVWGGACDVINLTKGRQEMATHRLLRDQLTQHVGNNYRSVQHD